MRTIFRIILAVVAAVVSAAEAKGYTLADEQARTTPDWFRKGVMYQIQPRAFTVEGTIKAAEAKLPELAAMGVTVVYMCPVTAADDDPREDMWSPRQVKSGFNNPRNPYRTGDYFHVDPEYGTDEDLRSFVKAAHANGVKVLLDMVFLHCGPSARVLKDHPEYFSYDKDGKIVTEGWRFPKLDFTNRAVHEYFKANMVYWLADFDVDGFRCDVADCIPLDFWEEARDVCERIKDGIVILAEGCRHANTRHAFDANYNWPVCLSWLRPILKSDSKEGYNQQWAAGGVDVSKFKGVAKLRAAALIILMAGGIQHELHREPRHGERRLRLPHGEALRLGQPDAGARAMLRDGWHTSHLQRAGDRRFAPPLDIRAFAGGDN